MPDGTNLPITEVARKSRRDFVWTSARVAVTAPAVAVLMSASTKRAMALTAYQGSSLHILDDFTFGNNEEDIDARHFGSNFNPINGTPQQDDRV